MGRHRKTLAEHERDGTLNVTDHAGRIRAPKFDGEPEMPAGMPKDAVDHWRKVVPALYSKGVAKGVDSAALQAMCEAWADYRAVTRMKQPQKLEDRARFYRMRNNARRGWAELASKFGLTPVDRERLEVDSGGDKTNPLEQMLVDQEDMLKVVG